MTLITSLFNKSIYKNNLKRFTWGSVLYFIILFLSTTMVFLLKTVEEWLKRYQFSAVPNNLLLKDYNLFPTLVALVVPTVVAALIFRAVHSEKQSTFIHSLPVTKKGIFITNILSGITLMFIPIVLNGILLLLLSTLGGYGVLFNVTDVFIWIGINAFITFVLFSITSFVAMLTGNTIAHIVITYIFNFLPVALVGTISYIFGQTLFGYSPNNQMVDNVIEYTPIMNFLNHISRQNYKYDTGEVVGFIVMAILFYGFGLLIYKIRKSETAGDVISFKLLKPIFKYLMTFLTCLGVYSILLNISKENLITTLIWVFASSVIVYFSCEMLLKKTLKVFQSYKGYLGFVCVIAVIVILLAFDVFGFESYVPSANKVSSVAFKSSYSQDMREEFLLKDRENIETILALHQKIIAAKEEDEPNTSTDYKQISYTLENGRIVNRFYRIKSSDFIEQYEKLYANQEFKEKEFNEIFKFDIEKIATISIRSELDSSFYKAIEKKEEVIEFFEALKKDVSAIGYLEYEKSNRNNLSYIEFMEYKDQNEISTMHLNFNHSYKNIINFLKEKGYYEILFPKSEKISALSLSEIIEINQSMDYDYQVKRSMKMEDTNNIMITDKNDIDQIMELVYSGAFTRDEGNLTRYRTLFIEKNKVPIGYIEVDKEIPDVIKKYL